MEDRSPRVEETLPLPKPRESTLDRFNQRQTEEQIILNEPEPGHYVNEYEPTAVFDEPSFANDQRASQDSIDLVLTGEKTTEEPRPEQK